MFIVPLSGDKILSTNGATYTALGYTNVKDQPSVYVQGPEVETESLGFDQIAKINSAPVKLTGGKVFDAATKSKHKYTLPQKDDKVKFGNVTVKVNSLKLNQRGHLAAGMLIAGENVENKEKVTVRLANLVSIERASGDELFDLKGFKQQYRDYLGSETGAAA
jgi:hypothetical protein